MELKLIDNDGIWIINTAAFPMVDADTGNVFNPGIKYKVRESGWMGSQPVIVRTDAEDDSVVAILQEPNVTKDMAALRAAYNETHPDAPALSEPPEPVQAEAPAEPAPEAPAEPEATAKKK